MKGLAVYDPRSQDRIFMLDQAESWSSKEANVLFFETEDYRSYSSGEYVGKLLKALISESKVPKIAIRISNFKYELSRTWLERNYISGDVLIGIANVNSLDQVIQLFDEYADYQTWNFYGLGSDSYDLKMIKPFPEVLKYTHLFPFVLELDLDGMLLGYIAPKSDLDFLTDTLQNLGN